MWVHSALTKLAVGLYEDEDDKDKDKAVITMESSMTVADFSAKTLGAADAILIAAFLSKCQ